MKNFSKLSSMKIINTEILLHATFYGNKKQKKSPAVSFTAKLVKQVAKAHSEKMSFQQLFKLRKRICIFYMFRQIIPEKRFTYTKLAITIFGKRTRNIK